MAAYVISEVEICDEESAEHYRTLAAASIEKHGGRYLVRGAAPDVIEGGPVRHRLVIVQFPSMEQARAWYASADYARALAYRDKALRRRLTFVEGVLPF